jgi:hypothetical protein
MRFWLLIILACCVSPSAVAQENKPLIQIKKTPVFDLPIECEIGTDCWVMNYVDMIPDDGEQTDPACQKRTYDGHKGTDFMILDKATMQKGINVIAPLAGTVTKIRDGEPDRFPSEEELEQTKLARKECGNAVMIDHGEGLKTIYCHLKQNSIVVKQSQTLEIGDKIAQVGLSGLTQFPHLHFGILQDNKVIDPFTGLDNTQGCGKRKASLWKKELDLSYKPILIHNLGFSNDIPELTQIERNGNSNSDIKLDSEIMTFWTVLLGVQKDDKITLEIRDPNNKIFAKRNIIQDKTRARQFYYAGRRTNRKPLIEGAYTANVKVEREFKGQTIREEEYSVILATP